MINILIQIVIILALPTSRASNFDIYLNYSENRHYIDINQTIFFGDYKLDFEVASYYKIDFIYVEEDSEWVLDKRFQGLNTINNFNNLNYE